MDNSINSILSQHSSQPRILEIIKTLNGVLTIEETDANRWIRDNYGAYYTILDKLHSHRLVLPYLHSMMAALMFVPEPRSTLILGAGGGAIMRFLNHNFPDTEITSVDYDSRVIELTQKYFSISYVSQVNLKNEIINQEATEYLAMQRKDDYDLIFIDLFAHGEIPKLFDDINFYKNTKKCATAGVIVFNLIFDTETSFKNIMNYILATFNKRCLCLTISDYKNIIVIAFSDTFVIEKNISELRKSCTKLSLLCDIEFNELLDEIISSNSYTDNCLRL